MGMEGINHSNVKSGFEATGLWPFNLDRAISKMPINEQPGLDATGSVLVDFLKDKTDAIRPKLQKGHSVNHLLALICKMNLLLLLLLYNLQLKKAKKVTAKKVKAVTPLPNTVFNKE